MEAHLAPEAEEEDKTRVVTIKEIIAKARA
jgi:hypothetical protein